VAREGRLAQGNLAQEKHERGLCCSETSCT
jgi:hypothetical protein